jgi:hypothetical protein
MPDAAGGGRRWLFGGALGVLGAGVAAAALAQAGGGTPTSTAQISAYPVPGTQVASPRTQISLRGAPADQLGTVQVTGSRTGEKQGELRAHSDGQGASFVPSEPFQAGERITVRTDLQVRGARDGDFVLRVGRGIVSVERTAPRPPGGPAPDRGENRGFRTRRDLRPPGVTVTRRTPSRTGDGYVLVGPKKVFGARQERGEQEGVMIADDRGEPVYFRPMAAGIKPADIRVQQYRGRPVLTWWQGRAFFGQGEGEGIVLDEQYREVARVKGANGYRLDLHEFLITPRGTALVLAYVPVQRDLSWLGGPRDGRVVDNVVQEIDIATGLVLFEWHSVGTVPLQESNEPLPRRRGEAYDYFHANSVDQDENGDYLVSARHTSAVYKLDRETGGIEWKLGGKDSSFEGGRGTFIWRQHDARFEDGGRIRIFDNGASPPRRERSRAITVQLDEQARTARLVRSITHPDDLLSGTQANATPLPNGNVFIGWGSQGWFSEFTPDGRLLFDGRVERGYDSYRAYRAPWTGRPTTDPAVVASARGDRVTVSASWNGATEVARWQVLAGASADALQPVGSPARRTGFETDVELRIDAQLVAVRALDASGQELGTSRAVEVEER